MGKDEIIKINDLIYRFGGSDVKEYDYWIEPSRYIWINDSIEQNRDKKLRIYYGIDDSNVLNDPFNDGSCLVLYRFNGNANNSVSDNYHGVWYGDEDYAYLADRCMKIRKYGSYVRINNFPIKVFDEVNRTVSALYYEHSGILCLPVNSSLNSNRCSLHWRGISVYQGTDLSVSSNINFGIHHIVFVCNSSGRHIYIDGQLVASDSVTPFNNASDGYNNAYSIGSYWSSISHYPDRLHNDTYIDNFRIFNRALTETEVQELYAMDGEPFIIEQNPESVMIFFDGFDGDNINEDKWNVVDSTGISINNSDLKMESTSGRIDSKQTFSSPFILTSAFTVSSLPSNGIMVNGVRVSTTNSFGLLVHPDAPHDYYYRLDDGWNGSYTWSGDYTTAPTTISEIIFNNSGSVSASLMKRFDEGYKETKNYNKTVSSLPVSLGRRYDDGFTGQSCTIYIEYIYARKWTQTQPQVVVGSEVSGMFNVNNTKFKYYRDITISNQDTVDLVDYQIGINFNDVKTLSCMITAAPSSISNNYEFILKL